MNLPDYADVEAAARRLEGYAHRTPVLTSSIIDRSLGASVFFKCENFQRMGAFKFRGAFNALSRLDQPARALAPDCKVYGVEPEAGNDGQLPLRRGSIVRIEVPKTIADGLQTTSPSDLTFGIAREHGCTPLSDS